MSKLRCKSRMRLIGTESLSLSLSSLPLSSSISISCIISDHDTASSISLSSISSLSSSLDIISEIHIATASTRAVESSSSLLLGVISDIAAASTPIAVLPSWSTHDWHLSHDWHLCASTGITSHLTAQWLSYYRNVRERNLWSDIRGDVKQMDVSRSICLVGVDATRVALQSFSDIVGRSILADLGIDASTDALHCWDEDTARRTR
jgi:hypothetical protein